jgi:hypothetical protein
METFTQKTNSIDKIRCLYIEDGKQCKLKADRIYSLTAIKSDSMWSGVQTDYGYFTSQSQFENHLKQNHIARYEPGMKEQYQKVREQKKVEAKENNAKRIEKICADVVSKI